MVIAIIFIATSAIVAWAITRMQNRLYSDPKPTVTEISSRVFLTKDGIVDLSPKGLTPEQEQHNWRERQRVKDWERQVEIERERHDLMKKLHGDDYCIPFIAPPPPLIIIIYE